MGGGADLRTCLILGFLLSSHDMVTLVMRIKDERIRNAALLRYTCGHNGRYFGLFHLIVMDHHIASWNLGNDIARELNRSPFRQTTAT